MKVEVRHDNFYRLIDPHNEIEKISTGFDFVEGPIWHPSEQAVTFSDILGNSLYRWSEVDGLTKLRRNSYMANGNAFDQQGRVVTCEHATSRVTRTDFTKGGNLEVLATHFDDKQLNSPNDVVVKSDGGIYFTDPISGRSADFGVPRTPELPFSGVYRLDSDTNALTLLVKDFSKPNGLCFSEDETLLFVNDTDRQHIRVFEVEAEGTLKNGRLFANLTGNEAGVADGMKVDQEANIYSCGPGGLHIFNSAGECLGIIKMPEKTANFVFGGEYLQTLYITASTSLYSLRVKIPGVATFYPANY